MSTGTENISIIQIKPQNPLNLPNKPQKSIKNPLLTYLTLKSTKKHQHLLQHPWPFLQSLKSNQKEMKPRKSPRRSPSAFSYPKAYTHAYFPRFINFSCFIKSFKHFRLKA